MHRTGLRPLSPLAAGLLLAACYPRISAEERASWFVDTDAADSASDTDTDDPPVATCEAVPSVVSVPGGVVTLDGSESTAPDGAPIVGYDWLLTAAPDGGFVGWQADSSQPTVLFAPWMSGDYAAELVIRTQGATWAPCPAPFTAVPTEDLQVELAWELGTTNLDLHLIAPGGQPGTNLDCRAANCAQGEFHLDWGEPGEADDPAWWGVNDGVGPEGVGVSPVGDGVYPVVIGPNALSPATGTTAYTLSIYVRGALAYREGLFFDLAAAQTREVAQIAWPAGTVTACPTGGCP